MNQDNYSSYSIPVPEEFKDVFTHFYFAANHTTEPVIKTLYPAYQTIMVFNFGAKASLVTAGGITTLMDKCLILGPIKQAFEYTLPAGSEIMVANFKDDAFYRFFGNVALPEDLPFNPDQLLEEDCFTDLWYQLKDINDPAAKTNCLLDFCRPYLKDREAHFDPIAHFDPDDSRNPVKVIADATNRSERSVQMDYKKFFRYSAKEMNRYQRFRKASGILDTAITDTLAPDWFAIISACGYYDQSQLIHDFKHFTGLTPKQYVKFREAICRPQPE